MEEDKVLKFIREFKEQHGYEPEKMTIHKATNESRPKIDSLFVKYVERGDVQVFEIPRSSNYILK